MEQTPGMARCCKNFTTWCSREVEGSREEMDSLSKRNKANFAESS